LEAREIQGGVTTVTNRAILAGSKKMPNEAHFEKVQSLLVG
jgi:hypothetical protein